jgi:hypothetical protein
MHVLDDPLCATRFFDSTSRYSGVSSFFGLRRGVDATMEAGATWDVVAVAWTTSVSIASLGFRQERLVERARGWLGGNGSL